MRLPLPARQEQARKEARKWASELALLREELTELPLARLAKRAKAEGAPPALVNAADTKEALVVAVLEAVTASGLLLPARAAQVRGVHIYAAPQSGI